MTASPLDLGLPDDPATQRPVAVGPLAHRTALAAAWWMALRVTQQLLSLAQILILARLLAPREFGLMGIALLAVRFGEYFTYTGFEYALVQRRQLRDVDLDTAWWFTLARRLLLALGMIALASPVAEFFHEPGAATVLRVLSLGQVAQGLTSLSPTLLQRNLQFGRQFLVSTPSGVIAFVAAVAAALALRNVFALVVGTLVYAVVTCILSYAVHPYRPRFRFDRRAALELGDYGKWMLASAVIALTVSQGSDTLGGWMFGAAALGVYQMSTKFGFLPTSFGDMIVSSVFPSYAMIQQDAVRLRKAFLRVLNLAVSILLPTTILVGVFVPAVVGTALGERWLEVGRVLPAVAMAGLVQSLVRTASPLFLATGHPKAQFAMDSAAAVGMLVFTYPLARGHGLMGLAAASALASLCALPVWGWGIRRYGGCSAAEIGRAGLAPASGALLMAALAWAGAAVASQFDPIAVRLACLTCAATLSLCAYLLVATVASRLVPEYDVVRDLYRVAWKSRAR